MDFIGDSISNFGTWEAKDLERLKTDRAREGEAWEEGGGGEYAKVSGGNAGPDPAESALGTAGSDAVRCMSDRFFLRKKPSKSEPVAPLRQSACLSSETFNACRLNSRL